MDFDFVKKSILYVVIIYIHVIAKLAIVLIKVFYTISLKRLSKYKENINLTLIHVSGM